MVCLMRMNRSYRIVRNAGALIGRVLFDNSTRFAWSSGVMPHLTLYGKW